MSEADRLREAIWSAVPGGARLAIEATATALGIGVYVVGGSVRDLLLGLQPSDLDLTVEGDGAAFAESLATAVGGEVRRSPRFLAALVESQDGQQYDVTTARTESYAAAGALPEVTPSSIDSDLKRRDFSVNTFALGIAGEVASDLLHVEGARADLEARSLRVLHENSFDDDPTRLLRAARLELQLDFRLSRHSEELGRHAVGRGVFSRVSGERIWRELAPLANDVRMLAAAFERLDGLGVLSALVAGLGWSRRQAERLADAAAALRQYGHADPTSTLQELPLVCLLALASGQAGYRGEELSDRLALPAAMRRVLTQWPERARRAGEAVRRRESLPSAVHETLRQLSAGELAFLAGELDQTGVGWLQREMIEMRQVALTIRAADLLAAGHHAGPAIGRALELTLAARLDETIGPQGELDYALAVLNEATARFEEDR